MPTWHEGNVCVIGDAAWCVSPIAGGGASLALVSGYVLAACLSTAENGRLEPALVEFETWMRPLVDDVQKLPRGIERFACPQTRFGLALRGLVVKALTSRPLKPLAARFTQAAHYSEPLPELSAPLER
jgi:2-polyprenyl-6-methoxyphenol hydroxylase-like FAD-dependent oxidoreductase